MLRGAFQQCCKRYYLNERTHTCHHHSASFARAPSVNNEVKRELQSLGSITQGRGPLISSQRRVLSSPKRYTRDQNTGITYNLSQRLYNVIPTDTQALFVNMCRETLREHRVPSDRDELKEHYSELVHNFLSLPSQALVEKDYPTPATDTTPAKDLEQLIKRANFLVSQGKLGRAAKVFTQSPTAKIDPNGLQQLKRLHPPLPTTSRIPPLPRNAPLYKVKDAKLRSALEQICKGTSPGVSGHTAEMLRTVTSDPGLFEALCAIITQICNGNLDPNSALRAGLLIPIMKKDGSIRPIVVTEALLRLASTLIFNELAPHLTELFPDIQLGMGVSDGCTRALHAMQALCEKHGENGNWVVACLDSSNAFNTLDRGRALQCVFAQPLLKKAWRLIHWIYSTPSPLVFRDAAGKTQVLLSRTGVKQGDGFGSLIFDLAVQVHFQNTQNQHISQPATLLLKVVQHISQTIDFSHITAIAGRQNGQTDLTTSIKSTHPERPSPLTTSHSLTLYTHHTTTSFCFPLGLQVLSFIAKNRDMVTSCHESAVILVLDAEGNGEKGEIRAYLGGSVGPPILSSVLRPYFLAATARGRYPQSD